MNLAESIGPQLPSVQGSSLNSAASEIEAQSPQSARHCMPLVRRTPARTPSVSGFAVKASTNVGIIIGARYVVEGFLAEGGTAMVYLARDLKTDRLVVVKRMKPEVAETPELRRRFLFEAHALARVQHPAVVRVLDISPDGGSADEDESPYLVLEALRGESLGDYLRRHQSMSVEMTCHLMRQAAMALAAVHEAGIVHRDLKPDNLFLVGPLDEPSALKVLDFGMAHVVEDGHDAESTDILGTAQYMAPEQILVEPVDARTDVYGMGVVLFRMLTGHLPFDAKNKHDLLRHQLFSPVPPASWLVDDLPRELERIVHRATRKSPSARFESASEMVQAFDQLLGVDEPLSSRTIQSFVDDEEPDVYQPSTSKGRHAAQVLAVEFGIYSRPHKTLPPGLPSSHPPSPPFGEH